MAILVLVPSAAAEAAAVLDTASPIRIDGLVALTGESSRVFVEAGSLSLVSEGRLHGATVTYTTWRAAKVGGDGSRLEQAFDVEHRASSWQDASVLLALHAEPAALRAASTSGGVGVAGAFSGDGHPLVLGQDFERERHAGVEGGHPLAPYERAFSAIPGGWFFAGRLGGDTLGVEGYPRLDRPLLALDGAGVVQITGGNLSVAGADARVERYRLGAWEEAPGIVRRGVVEIRFADAAWSMPLAGARWALGAPNLEIAFEGVATLRDAVGPATQGGVQAVLTGQDATFTGSAILRPVPLARDEVTGEVTTFRYEISGADVSLSISGLPLEGAGGTAARVAAGTLLGVIVHLVAAYHRLPPNDVLTNPMRRRILEAVRESPGLHLRALERELGLKWGRLLYHLDVLRRANYVVVHQVGRYRVVHAVGDAPPGNPPPRPLHPLTQAVLSTVRAEKRIRARELQDRLKISRQRLAYHIRTLERADLLHVEATTRGLVLVSADGRAPLPGIR